MHNGEVLRINEGPSGSVPELDKPFYHYCVDGVFEQEPKLDRVSLLKFAAVQRTTGLVNQSYEKYVHLDAPFKEIYVIELAQSKVLCTA